jgi:hypothetical protein
LAPVPSTPELTCPQCGVAVSVEATDVKPGTSVEGSCPSCARVMQFALRDDDFDGDGVLARGRDLIVQPGAESPPRCVKCNAPAEHIWTKTLYWHHPALYWLILAGLLIYAVIALVVRKSAFVSLFLCPAHLAKRRKNLLVGWLVLASSIGFWVLAFRLGGRGNESRGLTLMLGGFVALCVGLVWIARAANVVLPRRIEDGVVTLKGAGPEFLASLPRG